MVAQRDPKRHSVLAWSSFEHSRGQEIMIDDDHHHMGGFLTRIYGSFAQSSNGLDGR